jgi:hypothetical protein
MSDTKVHVSLRQPMTFLLNGYLTAVQHFDAIVEDPGQERVLSCLTDRIWKAGHGIGLSTFAPVGIRTTVIVPLDNVAGIVVYPPEKS